METKELIVTEENLDRTVSESVGVVGGGWPAGGMPVEGHHGSEAEGVARPRDKRKGGGKAPSEIELVDDQEGSTEAVVKDVLDEIVIKVCNVSLNKCGGSVEAGKVIGEDQTWEAHFVDEEDLAVTRGTFTGLAGPMDFKSVGSSTVLLGKTGENKVSYKEEDVSTTDLVSVGGEVRSSRRKKDLAAVKMMALLRRRKDLVAIKQASGGHWAAVASLAKNVVLVKPKGAVVLNFASTTVIFTREEYETDIRDKTDAPFDGFMNPSFVTNEGVRIATMEQFKRVRSQADIKPDLFVARNIAGLNDMLGAPLVSQIRAQRQGLTGSVGEPFLRTLSVVDTVYYFTQAARARLVGTSSVTDKLFVKWRTPMNLKDLTAAGYIVWVAKMVGMRKPLPRELQPLTTIVKANLTTRVREELVSPISSVQTVLVKTIPDRFETLKATSSITGLTVVAQLLRQVESIEPGSGCVVYESALTLLAAMRACWAASGFGVLDEMALYTLTKVSMVIDEMNSVAFDVSFVDEAATRLRPLLDEVFPPLTTKAYISGNVDETGEKVTKDMELRPSWVDRVASNVRSSLWGSKTVAQKKADLSDVDKLTEGEKLARKLANAVRRSQMRGINRRLVQVSSYGMSSVEHEVSLDNAKALALLKEIPRTNPIPSDVSTGGKGGEKDDEHKVEGTAEELIDGALSGRQVDASDTEIRAATRSQYRQAMQAHDEACDTVLEEMKAEQQSEPFPLDDQSDDGSEPDDGIMSLMGDIAKMHARAPIGAEEGPGLMAGKRSEMLKRGSDVITGFFGKIGSAFLKVAGVADRMVSENLDQLIDQETSDQMFALKKSKEELEAKVLDVEQEIIDEPTIPRVFKLALLQRNFQSEVQDEYAGETELNNRISKQQLIVRNSYLGVSGAKGVVKVFKFIGFKWHVRKLKGLYNEKKEMSKEGDKKRGPWWLVRNFIRLPPKGRLLIVKHAVLKFRLKLTCSRIVFQRFLERWVFKKPERSQVSRYFKMPKLTSFHLWPWGSQYSH